MNHFYGVQGEIKLTNIQYGIAYFGDDYLVDSGRGDGSSMLKIPVSFGDMSELIDTALLRNHKITGYVTSENGGCYYATE